MEYKKAINAVSLDSAITKIQDSKNYCILENMSSDYKNAVVATEDHRFYSHNGIDIISILHSTYVNVRYMSFDYGASTITQQLGRIMYFTQEKSIIRKVAKIFVALGLERNYSKDKILELYTNVIYFGNGYYGIYDASKGFFDISPKKLDFYQATYLAGLPNAPSIYSENEELGEERRLQVVNAMEKYGF